MRAAGAGTRIFELLDRTPAIQPGMGVAIDPKRTGPLRFENVAFSYPTRSGVNVLENFNLDVQVGENVAIVYVLSQTSKARPLILEQWAERRRQVIRAFLIIEILRPRSRQNHVQRTRYDIFSSSLKKMSHSSALS